MFSSIKPAVKPLRCLLLFCVCVCACKISRNSKGFSSKQSSLGLFFTPLYLSEFSSLFGGLFTACLLQQDISSTKVAPPRKHLWDTSTWNRVWHEGVSPGVSGEHLSTWMRREPVIPWGRDSKSGGGGPLPRELGYEADLREGQEAGSRGRTQETRGSTGSWEGTIRDREGITQSKVIKTSITSLFPSDHTDYKWRTFGAEDVCNHIFMSWDQNILYVFFFPSTQKF